MRLSIGNWTLVLTNKMVVEEPHVVIVDRPITVKRPVIREMPFELKIPTIKRVPTEIPFPKYNLDIIDHQVIIPRYHTNEKPYDVPVERPVVKETDKVIEVERLMPVDKEVEVPRYKVRYLPEEEVPVPLSASVITDVKCACGQTYTSNWTKCVHCGRSTIDNLKDMEKK